MNQSKFKPSIFTHVRTLHVAVAYYCNNNCNKAPMYLYIERIPVYVCTMTMGELIL